jgi:hypothetical protein
MKIGREQRIKNTEVLVDANKVASLDVTAEETKYLCLSADYSIKS